MQNPTELQKNKSAFNEVQGEIVVGRMPRGYLLLFCFPLIMGVLGFLGMYFTSPNSGSLGIVLFMAAMCSFPFLLGVFGLWLFARTCVIADQSGLRWREMGGWKSATWMQVRDYYTKKLPKSGASYIVETDAGKLSWSNLSQSTLLRQVVQERARWAQAKSWEERSITGESLELTEAETFEADQGFARFFWVALAVVIGLPLLLPMGNGPIAAYNSFMRTWQTIGPIWALGQIGIVLFFSLVYGLMIFAQWPIVRALKQRKNQSITISPFGLIWRDTATGHQIDTSWEEVRDFYIDEVPGWVKTNARGVVETTRGNFDFICTNSGGKRNARRLRALIQKYCARHGLEQEWETRDKSHEAALARASEATQIFTYRDSPLRVMILFVTFLASDFCYTAYARYTGIIAVPNQKPHDLGDLLMGLFIGGPTTALSIWMWWQYFCFQILTDKNGITQRCGHRTKSIAWPNVREYETAGGWGIVRSETQVIRFFGAIGGSSKLQKVIQERAMHSKTRSW